MTRTKQNISKDIEGKNKNDFFDSRSVSYEETIENIIKQEEFNSGQIKIVEKEFQGKEY